MIEREWSSEVEAATQGIAARYQISIIMFRFRPEKIVED
jgi:hypothetical protein